MTWKDAVRKAIPKVMDSNGVFTRQDLLDKELDNMVKDTGSRGRTPDKSMDLTLQRLAEMGEIVFLDNNGTYRITDNFHSKG